jgi:hypothetical protein
MRNLISELKSQNQYLSEQLEKAKTLNINTGNTEIIDLGFPILFEDLRQNMARVYNETKGTGQVWLCFKVDIQGQKIVSFRLSIRSQSSSSANGLDISE